MTDPYRDPLQGARARIAILQQEVAEERKKRAHARRIYALEMEHATLELESTSAPTRDGPRPVGVLTTVWGTGAAIAFCVARVDPTLLLELAVYEVAVLGIFTTGYLIWQQLGGLQRKRLQAKMLVVQAQISKLRAQPPEEDERVAALLRVPTVETLPEAHQMIESLESEVETLRKSERKMQNG